MSTKLIKERTDEAALHHFCEARQEGRSGLSERANSRGVDVVGRVQDEVAAVVGGAGVARGRRRAQPRVERLRRHYGAWKKSV